MLILDSFILIDLILTVILSILAFGTVEPWSLAVFELNALFLAVLLSLRYAITPQGFRGEMRIVLPLLLLLILGVVQVVPSKTLTATSAPENQALWQLGTGTLSLDPNATRESLLKLLALSIYFAAAIQVLRDAARRRIAVTILTAFGVGVSIFAIAQRLTFNGKMYWIRPVSPYIAPFGPYGNYNHFAGMVELLLPLALAHLLFVRVNSEQRIIWFFSVVVMAAAAILSLSRAGFLSLSFQLALFLVFLKIRKSRSDDMSMTNNRAIIISALAAVITFACWIGYERLAERVVKIGEGTSEHSVVTRLEYWRASWRIFLDHPIYGVGLGAFPAIYPSYGRSSAKYDRVEQAHNDYLQLLTDTGLIGGLTGLWFLFEIVRAARRQFARQGAHLGRNLAIVTGGYISVAGMLAHSFVDFNLQIAANALLFLFVVALATASNEEEDRETR